MPITSRSSSGIVVNSQYLLGFKIMDKNDDQLISNYLEGDEKALGVLVDRYLADVHSFALQLTHNPQAAEDMRRPAFFGHHTLND